MNALTVQWECEGEVLRYFVSPNNDSRWFHMHIQNLNRALECFLTQRGSFMYVRNTAVVQTKNKLP